MDKISAVVITYNAEATIATCIDALKAVSDEIIIIDSFSTDSTPQLCNQNKIIFFQKAWEGYGPQKNFGISKASNNYILSVDADEIISNQLAASILNEKKSGLINYYSFLRINHFYFQFSKHGAAKPEAKIRLFDKKFAQWDNKEVHENLIIDNSKKTSQLKGSMLHYSYSSISHHLQKLNNYTTLGAQESFKKGKKNILFKMILGPPINFFINYFVRFGFLDGVHGFVVASITAHQNFVKYAKLWEIQMKEKIKAEN